MTESIAQYIQTSIEQDLFNIEYQPQFCLADGGYYKIIALESLLQHDSAICDKELLFKTAIATNQMIDLGYYIFEKVVRQMRIWLDRGLIDPSFQIAINVFGEQFADKLFCKRVDEIVNESGIDPSQLTLEILETTLVDDENIDRIHNLVDKGFTISIDDFGTGYSSLARLKLLPINEIKIDKMFLADITNKDSDLALIKAIHDLACALDKFTVVEGVENKEQYDHLRAIGFRCFQGFFFSNNESVEDIEKTISLVNSVCSYYYQT